MPLVMLEVLPRKVMALDEKAEVLDTYCRLKSAVRVACHFKMNESNVSIIVKKKKRKSVKPSLQLHQQAQKPCTSCEIPLSHVANAAFMWVQDYDKAGTPTDEYDSRKSKVIM